MLRKAITIIGMLSFSSAVLATAAPIDKESILLNYSNAWDKFRTHELDTSVYIYPVSNTVSRLCRTEAPPLFINNIVKQWSDKMHASVPRDTFLREDQESYRRLAIMSCLYGAEFQTHGSGHDLNEGLNKKLQQLNLSAGNDFYQQIKAVEWKAGIETAALGMTLATKDHDTSTTTRLVR